MRNDLKWEEPRRAAGGMLAHVGILTAVLTVAVFSALFFAELTFTVEGGIRFGLHFVLLCFASYTMYFSLSEVGVDRALQSEGARRTLAALEQTVARARGERTMADLRGFCHRFAARETAERRALTLAAYDLDEAELARLRAQPRKRLPYRMRRALRAVEGLAPVRITPSMLLSDRIPTGMRPPLARTPRSLRLRRTLCFLIPTALTALFSVSVVCEVIASPTPDVLVGFLLKLFTLFSGGAKGFRDGHRHVTEDRLPYAEERTEILEEFLKSTPTPPVVLTAAAPADTLAAATAANAL